MYQALVRDLIWPLAGMEKADLAQITRASCRTRCMLMRFQTQI
jgi:hypothetical protein